MEKIRNGNTRENAYSRYLEWFKEKANADAEPKSREDFLSFHIGNEDLYENDTLLLNRLFFLIPLFPSAAKSGKLETFVVSELNLMEKAEYENGADDILYIDPIEYEKQCG